MMNLVYVVLTFTVCFGTRCWILDGPRVTEIDEASADTLQSWFIGDFGADTLWVDRRGRIVHAVNRETGERATIDRLLVRVTRYDGEGSWTLSGPGPGATLRLKDGDACAAAPATRADTGPDRGLPPQRIRRASDGRSHILRRRCPTHRDRSNCASSHNRRPARARAG